MTGRGLSGGLMCNDSALDVINNRSQFLHMNECEPSDILYLMGTTGRGPAYLGRHYFYDHVLDHLQQHRLHECCRGPEKPESRRQEDGSSTPGSCSYSSERVVVSPLLPSSLSFPPLSRASALQRKPKLFPALFALTL